MADPEIPGWEVDLSERSPGVWVLSARHVSGQTFEITDHDIDRAFERLNDFDAEKFGGPPNSLHGA